MADFDVKQIKGNDRIIVGAGVVVLVASLLPWYGVSSGGFSASVSGWGAGFLSILAILLSLAAAGYVAARSMGQLKELAMPIGPAVLTLALSGASVLLILIRWASLPSYGGLVNAGPRIGLFLALLATIVQVAFAVMSFRASGEPLPGQKGKTPPVAM